MSQFAPIIAGGALCLAGLAGMWWMERTKPVLIRYDDEYPPAL